MLLADGKINGGNANSLTSKLEGTQKALENGNVNAASGKLGAVLNELDANGSLRTCDGRRHLGAAVAREAAAGVDLGLAVIPSGTVIPSAARNPCSLYREAKDSSPVGSE